MEEPANLEDLVAEVGSEKMQPQYEDVAKKIEEYASRLREMSPEDQEEFFKGMGIDVKMMGDQPAGEGSAVPGMEVMPFLICFVIVLSVFVFFGYKLYKSLTEKERKRDEKKKQKQMKKKK